MLIINTAWNYMEVYYIQDVTYAYGHPYLQTCIHIFMELYYIQDVTYAYGYTHMQNCIHVINTAIICAAKHESFSTVSALIQ